MKRWDLVITQSELADQGLYQCVVENQAGRLIETARLQIDWDQSKIYYDD